MYPQSDDCQGVFGMDSFDLKQVDDQVDPAKAANQSSRPTSWTDGEMLREHNVKLQRGKRMCSARKSDEDVAKSWQRRLTDTKSGFVGLSADTPAIRSRPVTDKAQSDGTEQG